MATGWDGLINDLNRVIKNDRAIRTALTSVLPVHKKRIFESGKSALGAQIGTYGTKPISIAKKNQARQTGHSYFKGGYSQYKREIGKNPGFVILRNTDQMQVDYGLQVLGSGSFGYGFTNSKNYDKSQWVQDKYDKDIFALSTSEQDLIGDIMTKELFK
jgi:hypothetical protein